MEDAIALAREADTGDLFERSKDENEEELLGMRRGAVAAASGPRFFVSRRFLATV
jgi:hypothetical protein